jgi:hypothetical protein
LTFSEPIDAASVGTATYTFSGGITASAPVVVNPNAGGNIVRLTTSRQAEDTEYTVTVTGIRDRAANVIAAPGNTTTFRSFVFKPGFAKFETYENIGGNSVENNLKPDPKYPDSPDQVRTVTLWEGPTNILENYGVRISGFVTPTETANYVFYISTDDNGELWVSTDENPANIALIASEPQWNGVRQWLVTDRRNPDAPENKSAPIALQAGRRYYAELLYKEGGGGDNGAMVYVKESDPPPANGSEPAGGAKIGQFIDPNSGPPVFTTQPVAQSVNAGGSATFTASVQGELPLSLQWRKGGQAIAGATTSSLTVSNVGVNDISDYDVVATNAAGTATSAAAPLFINGAFYIEAEDFNYDNGKHIAAASTMPYLGGAYNGLSAVAGVDYNDPGANENVAYRAADQTVAMVQNADVARGGFTLTSNFKVGWNDAGEYYNYTRNFPAPAQNYNVIGRISSGGAASAVELGEVTGATTAAQTYTKLGTFSGPASGGWDTFLFYPLRTDAGGLVSVNAGGEKTYRLTILPNSNEDINYFMFVPGGGAPPPEISVSRTATGVQITYTGTLYSAPTITGAFGPVAGATSPYTIPASTVEAYFRAQ